MELMNEQTKNMHKHRLERVQGAYSIWQTVSHMCVWFVFAKSSSLN